MGICYLYTLFYFADKSYKMILPQTFHEKVGEEAEETMPIV